MPIFSPDRHACAPSYVKLTKQPIAGGTYRPFANDEDSNACAPSALSGHYGSKLYTQKSAIHAISDNASVFIPKVDAPHLPKTTDDKSIDEAINEAANDSTHSAPPSTEIQLAQANEHPLMQAVEVCKQPYIPRQKHSPPQDMQLQKLPKPPATPSIPPPQR